MQDILKAYGLAQIPVGLNDAEETGSQRMPGEETQQTQNQDQDTRIIQNTQDIQRNTRQIDSNARAIELVPTEPIPVYNANDPIQYLNYGVQGIIFLLVITFGKPLIDQFSLLFSERARIKASKEDKVLDVQMSSSKMILESQADQRDFLQNMIHEQQTRLTSEGLLEREARLKQAEQFFKKIDEQTRVMRNTNLILREVAAILNYQHKISTGQPTVIMPELYQEEKDLEKATVTLTNPLVVPPDQPLS